MATSGRADNVNRKKAQAVIELATFGAVIIFIIGLIINAGTSSAYQQNAALQSMRLAMLQSYQSSQRTPPETAFNTTAFVLVDDRLSVSAGKYGSTDRQPFATSGSGTMTKNIFFPVDASDLDNNKDLQLSTMLVGVNGLTFRFRLADWVRYRIRYWHSPDYMSSRVKISLIVGACMVSTQCLGAAQSPTSCEVLLGDSNVSPVRTKFDEQARRLKYEWWWYGYAGSPMPPGAVPSTWKTNDNYPPFYQSMAKRNTGFETDVVAGECSSPLMMRRYDQNRNGVYPDMCCINPLQYIIWRWGWKSLTNAAKDVDPENGIYPNFDIDGDIGEETLYSVSAFHPDCYAPHPVAPTPPGTTGPEDILWGYDVAVIDWDVGDINNGDDASNYANTEDAPGLKDDMKIYSWQGSAAAKTYMDITETATLCTGEGGASKSCARSTLKRNNVDLVERRFVLNSKMLGTYSYPNAGGLAVFSGSLCPALSSRNPDVERCCTSAGCCDTANNNSSTCFMSLPNKKVLYMRSRIADKRGRAWLTDTSTSEKF